ncbi:hypothetical protein BC827DRAFT_1262912 [Russula dissimulans]|nr:hypothetical protein BC827DRAFT_1262912 [Russula dissimulans]
MSQVLSTPSTSTSTSPNFQSVLNAALEKYENKTKNKLLTHPLAAQLQSCNSPAEILSVLEGLVRKFDQRRASNDKLQSWLNPTVNVLYAFSATLGAGVGLVFSPANVIFAGIGVLLLAAMDMDASDDVLVDIFGRIENFFRRLEAYTEVRPTAAMMDIVVNIMVEVLTILGIATKEIKERRAKKYMKKLLGKNDIESALKRLDTLTQEEARMATLEVLKMMRVADDKVNVVLDVTQQNANNTNVIIQHVDEAKREELRQDIHRWLSPPDPSVNHNTACNVQHQVAATWFFDGGIYNKWKSSPSFLWISGKPGSGKSILCSAIIEDIMVLSEAGSANLAYFYCDFRDEDKQSHHNLLLSILSQLSAQSNLCFDTVSRIYTKHGESTRKPSDAALINCLKETLSHPSQQPFYLIVDALDECPNNSGMPSRREQVLDLIKHLVELSLPNLHICATSRPEIDIKDTLEPLTSLRVSLHDQTGQRKDIIEYVSSVVYSDTKIRRWREEDKRFVIETLSERADGMFRWVYCQLEALRHCLPPSVRGILDELPETLDETYERILRDINKANREHARRLLQCLTVAIRPLRVEELAEVLAVDFDAALRGGVPKLNRDWRWSNQHQAVLSTCSSLIAIVDDGDSQVVQFSHFSVKEFLTSDRLACSSGDVSRYHIVLSPAHTILAQACLGVLLCLDEHVTEDNAHDIPLAKYAAQFWVEHARFEDVSSRIRDVMEYFFDDDRSHWAAWLRVHNMDRHSDVFVPKEFTDDAVPLYYAALCGFYDLAERLVVKNPEHVNANGGRLEAPLVAALRGKHYKIAELLHKYGANFDVRGLWEYTPLHFATWPRIGRVDIAEWLLDHGADVNSQAVENRVPLFLAAGNGSFEICWLLQLHNADLGARTIDGATVLHRAASPVVHKQHDQLKIMRLLLDQGVDVDARDNHGRTPLHYSSFYPGEGISVSTRGTVEGSRLLLERGADIQAKDDEGQTPLQLALENEHHEMAEFLLGMGAK